MALAVVCVSALEEDDVQDVLDEVRSPVEIVADIARAEHVFDLIVNYEESWDQSTWRRGAKTSCGTAMCFAGWAAVAEPGVKWAVRKPQVFDPTVDSYDDEEDNESLAQAILIKASERNQYQDVDDPSVSYAFQVERGSVTRWAVTVETYARRLLGVAEGEHDQPLALDGEIFYGYNSLAEIRKYIDQARAAQGKRRRDFRRESVKDLSGPAVAGESKLARERRLAHRSRVRAFNKRARGGKVCTARELAAAERDLWVRGYGAV